MIVDVSVDSRAGMASVAVVHSAALMLGKKLASVASFLAVLLLSVPADSQESIDNFRAVEETFNNKLSLTNRIVFQNAMIAAGFLNAVPTDRFSLRLFRGIQRFQRDAGLPVTGEPDPALVDRVFASAVSMFRVWNLQRFAHPIRGHSIILPTGMGLERVSNDRGIAFSDPAGKIRIRYNHFPLTSAAENYSDLVSKYERSGVKINFKVFKDGWFVISTTSAGGVDGYLRYHTDGDGITGFALFWDNQKGNVAAERIATIVSASLWASMTGAPFVDPPSGIVQAVAREQSPSPPPLPQASPSLPPASTPLPSARISSGTGFFVSTDGIVVTNHHVVDSCSSTNVQTSDRKLRPARILAADRNNDLALLKVDVAPRSYAALRVAARLGEDIAVFGFPQSDILATTGNFTTGGITATSGLADDTRYYQMSAPVQSGNSGGPMFDDRGNVVGVVTAKLNDRKFAERNGGEVPQNVNFALKTSLLITFLEGNGVPFTPPKVDAQRLERPEIAERARDMSVYVVCQ